MAGPTAISLLEAREPLVILVAAAVVVPLLHRLKISPVLGFILCGIVLGPSVLGAFANDFTILRWLTIQDREAIAPVAELGIMFLLFAIGLELSFERLLLLRKLVFGLGSVQLMASAIVLGAGMHLVFGLDMVASAVLGLALGLSSTAVVIQTLIERGQMARPEGRAAFGVLLFQDLAVVPVLFGVSMMAPDRLGAGVGGLVQSLLGAALAVGAVIVIGRVGLRPLFRQAARTGSPEVFMALCLLVVVGIGLITAAAGLSMALGAFLAGLLLAETEYRRQVETTIEPFKGLLLGVFLVSIGMSVDVGQLAAAPLPVLAAVVALIAVKAGIVAMAGPVFGVRRRAALHAGLVTGPGGEFAFVVLGVAVGYRLISQPASDFALLVTTVSMCLIPLLARFAGRGSGAGEKKRDDDTDEATSAMLEDAGHVIVAGYGRVGRTVVDLLEHHGVRYVAIDASPDNADRARKDGRRVYFGNAARPAMLKACGLDRASALVVTMDGGTSVDEVVASVHRERPDLPIICRARDARHAGHLYAMGVREAVPETFEASLQLGEALLVEVGVPMGRVIATVHQMRADFRTGLMEASSSTLPSERLRVLRDRAESGSPKPD
ncbi:MAG: cation:proton antiporter [Hyphomonadaceae bacterium]|nr:cation:proton antiporter [Hyphomonadaceae bacterium]